MMNWTGLALHDVGIAIATTHTTNPSHGTDLHTIPLHSTVLHMLHACVLLDTALRPNIYVVIDRTYALMKTLLVSLLMLNLYTR